jgi:hypothetical protein
VLVGFKKLGNAETFAPELYIMFLLRLREQIVNLLDAACSFFLF